MNVMVDDFLHHKNSKDFLYDIPMISLKFTIKSTKEKSSNQFYQ